MEISQGRAMGKGMWMRTRADREQGGLQQIGQSVPTHLRTLTAPQKRLLDSPGDADGGIIYQHSVLCQTCLPYRNPGDNHRRWTRKNGFLKLEVDAGRAFDSRVAEFVDLGLPFGPKPRLVLYHLNAEALRTCQRRSDYRLIPAV